MPLLKAAALLLLMVLLVIIVLAVMAVDTGVWAIPHSNRASSAVFMLAVGKQLVAAGGASRSTTSSASIRVVRF